MCCIGNKLRHFSNHPRDKYIVKWKSHWKYIWVCKIRITWERNKDKQIHIPVLLSFVCAKHIQGFIVMSIFYEIWHKFRWEARNDKAVLRSRVEDGRRNFWELFKNVALHFTELIEDSIGVEFSRVENWKMMSLGLVWKSR